MSVFRLKFGKASREGSSEYIDAKDSIDNIEIIKNLNVRNNELKNMIKELEISLKYEKDKNELLLFLLNNFCLFKAFFLSHHNFLWNLS